MKGQVHHNESIVSENGWAEIKYVIDRGMIICTKFNICFLNTTAGGGLFFFMGVALQHVYLQCTVV